jgi:hypothetical protein
MGRAQLHILVDDNIFIMLQFPKAATTPEGQGLTIPVDTHGHFLHVAYSTLETR